MRLINKDKRVITEKVVCAMCGTVLEASNHSNLYSPFFRNCELHCKDKRKQLYKNLYEE